MNLPPNLLPILALLFAVAGFWKPILFGVAVILLALAHLL